MRLQGDVPVNDAMGATQSIFDLEGRVRSELAAWAGHSVLQAAMRAFPGVEVYVAGGLLRNIVLDAGHKIKDIDLFLGGDSVQPFLERFSNHGSLWRGPFGAPRWQPDAGDACYADLIPILGFHNGLWPCENILDVLNQFDFTANALAMDLRSGCVFDPQNARRDLDRCIMRAVRFDYPDEPFLPDYRITRPAVVWFRIIHYASAQGLTVEPVTQRWLQMHRHYWQYRGEFEKLFFPLHPDALDRFE